MPVGEFYVKTAPSKGDTGVSDVISVEAMHKTYEGDGDISVPLTVGFGHLPGKKDYADDVNDTFYIEYKLFESPWIADNEPVWENRVDYSESYYASKYDSTVQNNPKSFIFARYGEFYPLYREEVEILFPAGVDDGYVTISISVVIDGEVVREFGYLSFNFERAGDNLTLTQ